MHALNDNDYHFDGQLSSSDAARQQIKYWTFYRAPRLALQYRAHIGHLLH
jgi:hypothetical protein